MKQEIEKSFLELVEFLQNNTGLAEYIQSYGGNDEKTDNYPEGEYATIERYLRREIEEEEIENYLEC